MIAGDMNRREFLKTSVGLAAAASGLKMIAGCATTEPAKVTALVYPPLPDKKIQPPREGCLVGFFKEPEASLKAKDSKFFYQRQPIFEVNYVNNDITYIENALNAKPSIIIIAGPKLYHKFPMMQTTMVAKRGILPYVHVDIAPFDSTAPIPGFSVKEIAQGQQDGHIKGFAQDASEFDKEYGGFFFSTMGDMNGGWFSWGKHPNFVPAWRHIWQIFDDQGANQYATWVWVPYCPEASEQHADDPELYYPGDKYVDWIGLNAFSKAGHPKLDHMLNLLMRETYRQLFKKHPQKPFMIPWFARTNEFYQSRWLLNAYSSIKTSFPAIKAAMYSDKTSSHSGDHTLNPQSWQTLKEIFKDPYWIMAK
jgi:hypothetical protein